MSILVGTGQLFALGFENGDEFGQDERQQENGHGHGHDHHYARICHGGADLAARFGFLAEVIGDLFEHFAHCTGRFGGFDQRDVRLSKKFRVPGQGGGEIVAGFDRIVQIGQHFLERGIVLLGRIWPSRRWKW